SVTNDLVVGGEGTGQLTVAAGGTVTATNVNVARGSDLDGAGTVQAAVTSVGTIAPDDAGSTGILSVSGSYTQAGFLPDGSDATGTLELDVEGTTPGTQHDVLAIDGSGTLDGVLALDVDASYTPSVGDGLALVTATAGLAGDFDVVHTIGLPVDQRVTTSGPALLGPGGYSITVAVNPTTLGFDAVDVTTAVVDTPTAGVLADFDGMDGPDLAVTFASTVQDQVVVFYNQGVLGGVWQGFGTGIGESDAVPLAFDPTDITAADLDGDGDLDIAISATEPGFHRVFLLCNNNGFSSVDVALGPASGIGTTPSAITSGNFDSDADVDLAVANAGSDDVTVLDNTGGLCPALTFVAATGSPFAVGSTPLDIAAGEFNGSGRDDLATANSGDDTVTFLGNVAPFGPTDWFLEFAEEAAGDRPGILEPEDVDNDKDLDVAVGNLDAGTVSLLLNEGSGAFSASAEMPLGDAMTTEERSVSCATT
ncbi:MAG: autotransporter outer membrane beta-barrel domain-containing protein, partial [Planctomycetota bacterium]